MGLHILEVILEVQLIRLKAPRKIAMLCVYQLKDASSFYIKNGTELDVSWNEEREMSSPMVILFQEVLSNAEIQVTLSFVPEYQQN